jgi:PAS domain S-box-containing protein
MSADNKGIQEKKTAFDSFETIACTESIRLIRIMDFIPDAIFDIDLKGKVIAWNKAMENISGIRAMDILGKGVYESALPLYRFRRPTLADLVLQQDPSIEAEYQNVKRDGKSISGEVNVSSFGQVGGHLWAKLLLSMTRQVIL